MKTNSVHPLWRHNQSSSFRSFGISANLNHVIANVIKDSLPGAIQHNTSILNKVGDDITLNTDIEDITGVIKELLDVIVNNSRDGNIHISADRYRDVVLLHIQERNNYNGYALSSRIAAIGPDAEMQGGHISISEPQRKITTITFSFPLQLQVA